jgi:hypothetical protein
MDHGVVNGGGESSEHSDSEPSSTSEESLCIGLESSDENLMDKADSESEDAPSDGISLAPSSEALRNWTGSSHPDRHFAGRTARVLLSDAPEPLLLVGLVREGGEGPAKSSR